MKIGIPRAFLYFKYKYLWETFFEELGCEIVLSEESNKKILEDGINLSIDESCLSAKIYIGHVKSLINECDYILVPRIESFAEKEFVCTKFNALPDIVKTLFKDIKLLDYNVDGINNITEKQGFIKMGETLGFNYFKSLNAYKKAKEVEKIKIKQNHYKQELLLNEDKLKILIVSHSYNIFDKLIGFPIKNYLEKLGTIPLYAHLVDPKYTIGLAENLSESLYWTYNKELIGAIEYYKNKIDGIIFVTAFPCGPDSLVTEVILIKVKDIPMANIIVDELDGQAGLYTRIESFIDIILEKHKKVNRVEQK